MVLRVQPAPLCQARLPSAPTFPGFILPLPFPKLHPLLSSIEQGREAPAQAGLGRVCWQLPPLTAAAMGSTAQPWDDAPKQGTRRQDELLL